MRLPVASLASLLLLALPPLRLWAQTHALSNAGADTNAAGAFQLVSVFHGTNGASPAARLLRGRDGFLYGTASTGGVGQAGSLFKVAPEGGPPAQLLSFDARVGAQPLSGLIQGQDAALYGTTAAGGASNAGCIFKLQPDGTGFTVLHTFAGGAGDGQAPRGGSPALLEAAHGILYGTTSQGGTHGYGTVFRLGLDGAGFTLVHSFDETNGAAPCAGLVPGPDGRLYGTTAGGGNANAGTIYALNPDGTGFTTLHAFTGLDGAQPEGTLLLGPDGSFYGTTFAGGGANGGTLFKVDAGGSNFVTLVEFKGANGSQPLGGLTPGSDGAWYGVTAAGGENNAGSGTLFRLQGTNLTLLHTFQGSDGEMPAGGLTEAAPGTWYGAASQGGPGASGVVFRLETTMTGPSRADSLATDTPPLATFNGGALSPPNPASQPALTVTVTTNPLPLASPSVSSILQGGSNPPALSLGSGSSRSAQANSTNAPAPAPATTNAPLFGAPYFLPPPFTTGPLANANANQTGTALNSALNNWPSASALTANGSAGPTLRPARPNSSLVSTSSPPAAPTGPVTVLPLATKESISNLLSGRLPATNALPVEAETPFLEQPPLIQHLGLFAPVAGQPSTSVLGLVVPEPRHGLWAVFVWGDGTPATEKPVVLGLAFATHTYAKAGAYTLDVKLVEAAHPDRVWDERARSFRVAGP